MKVFNLSKKNLHTTCCLYADFCTFIGNCDFWRDKKEQEFIEHTLDKLLYGYDDKMTWLRRYKNLLHPPHHQICHLHLRNNPYQEGHPRSCGECPRMSFLPVDYPYIFCVVSLYLDSYAQPPLKGVYHRKGICESHADDLFPRERDMAFSYISSRETRL